MRSKYELVGLFWDILSFNFFRLCSATFRNTTASANINFPFCKGQSAVHFYHSSIWDLRSSQRWRSISWSPGLWNLILSYVATHFSEECSASTFWAELCPLERADHTGESRVRGYGGQEELIAQCIYHSPFTIMLLLPARLRQYIYSKPL